MAAHFVFGLQLSIDTSVALLHTAGVPGHVKVEQVPAVGLKVQTFASGVSCDQDSDRMLLRRRIECPFDFFTTFRRRRPVEYFNTDTGLIRFGNGSGQLLDKIPLGVFVSR